MSHGLSRSTYVKLYTGLFLILLAGPLLIGYFENQTNPYAYFSLSKPTQSRYVAKILKEAPAQIDLVVLGASGSELAFDANELSDYWKSRGQVDPAIYNLAGFFANPVYNFGLVDALLEKRNVKLFVVEMTDWNEARHEHAFQFFRWRSPGLTDALQKASFETRLRFYAESVMGFPWRLWVLLHPEYPVIPSPANETWFSAIVRDKGAWNDITTDQTGDPNFIKLSPSKTDPHSYIIYDRTAQAEKNSQSFSLTPMQVQFLQYIKQQCEKKGCHLVLTTTQMPRQIEQPVSYPNNIPPELADTPILWVREKDLFGRYSSDVWQQSKLDPSHRNRTGRHLWTQTLAPVLYELAHKDSDEKR